jgi:myo-inositol-1(or 4)-monophosphatase
MSEILSVAVSAAKEAGDFLLHNFGKIASIERKKDKSLATNLDKEAEVMIVRQIRAKFPSHGIIGEEGGASNTDSDYVWVIDPLDGTHNFIRGINIFGVSIGIAYRDKFVAGAIYMPQEQEMYAGEAGSGAFKNDKKIHVSETRDLGESTISFDSSIRHAPEVMSMALRELAPKVFNVRMFGSSARILSYIAEGKLDLAVEFFDQPWDFAAGAAIVEAAGGKTISLKNKPLNFKDIGYMAANPYLFDEITGMVFSTIEKYNQGKR